ncbi:MAG TPA: MFS transporter [Thermoanaerobaculia bacterium]|nr:MFS transporter [Thermoanaerobaculia bacterium]
MRIDSTTIPSARWNLLARLGLHRQDQRAWAMYDWAISSVQTTVMVAVFPIFFIQVAGAEVGAARASQWWAGANGAAIAFVAILSPILGAIADYTGSKKRSLGVWMVTGAAGCAGMFLIGRGDLLLASLLFVIVAIGAASSVVFYDALLPHVAAHDEIDRVSSSAYAVGYFGGGVLLALNLMMIQKPQWFGLPSGDSTLAVRLSMVSVAVWWLLFSIPLFRRVTEPERRLESDEEAGQNPIRIAIRRLSETFHELRRYKHGFLMLLALLIYNDGIATIGRMAAAYGTELGIRRESLIAAILIVQFVGVPATFIFGWLASRVGAKRAIFLGLVVYAGISIFGYFMQTAAHFYVLAFAVGLVQGGTQALSRSLFAILIPHHKSAEFFGFYSVFTKFAGILGPLLFAGVIGATGSSRNAILSVIVFFFAGAAVLTFVNVEEGERVAREAERNTRAMAS